MGQVDALSLVAKVRRRMVDLAMSDNYIRDPHVVRVCRDSWEGPGPGGGLVSELWVEGTFPAESSGRTLGDLVNEGIFPKKLADQLDRSDRFPSSRTLFTHQEAPLRTVALDQQGNRSAFVVTAPTGAGKTESFLLPVLQDLWTHPDRDPDGGMRCLILYPMNALVADQIERVYGWLRGQSRLTVFHFNSSTPENVRAAHKTGEPRWEECRIRTRQQARGVEGINGERLSTPLMVPDIVITNYSMLEYMLCRPQDSRFFGPDLRSIVLDEAHLYSGTLAAEIALLLRRVRIACGVRAEALIQIATSATLGGTDEDRRNFTSSIFARPPAAVRVVKGEAAPLELGGIEAPPPLSPSPQRLAAATAMALTTLTTDDQFATEASDQVNRLAELLSDVASSDAINEARTLSPSTVGPFLKALLPRAPIVRRLAAELYGKRILSVDALAQTLWGQSSFDANAATTLLLRLCAAARSTPRELPLVPHRLHFLVRGPEGLSCCLNERCSGPAESKLPGVGVLQPSSDRCGFCQAATLPLHRCDACGEWAFATSLNAAMRVLEPGYWVSPAQRVFYLLAPERSRSESVAITVDPVTGQYCAPGAPGLTLFKAPCPEHGSTCTDPRACSQQACPACKNIWSNPSEEEADGQDRGCMPISSGDRLGVFVLAETVLNGLPDFPHASARWKPANGRRLLCFSDSRREAARLGPHLTSQHETWVARAAMNRVLARLPREELVAYFEAEIDRHKANLSSSGTRSMWPTIERKLAEDEANLVIARHGIPFSDFASHLGNDPAMAEILDPDLGDKHQSQDWKEALWEENKKKVGRHAEALIARELDGPSRRRISLESIGLLEVCYPGLKDLGAPAEILGVIPETTTRHLLDLNWPQILAALLDTVRVDRAVNWSQLTEGRKWQGESPLWDKWSAREKGGWSASAFVGSASRPLHRRQTRLVFARSILLAVGCSEQDAEAQAPTLLRSAFDQLQALAADRHSWLEAKVLQVAPDIEQPVIRITLDRLAFREPETLFRCPDTGTLWPRAVIGHAPVKGCTGRLMPVTRAEADTDPRWGRARREVRESEIFRRGLWGEEHSAQLSADENKRRQLLFRDGIRNILSSTTTMELGIDIGGLNGVLMSNVPPSRANHMQRAGRAGRRSDGSAIVVTFARERAFDRDVFRRFGHFLGAPLRRPVALLDRERLVFRHIHASLFGDFSRRRQTGPASAMGAYGTMGTFCGVTVPPKWNDERRKPSWVTSHPGLDKDFRDYLESLKGSTEASQRLLPIVERTPVKARQVAAGGDAWRAFLDDASQSFSDAVASWREEVSLLADSWNEISSEPGPADLSASRAAGNAIRYQIDARCAIFVIEWLAGKGFLPRYGFPINLQRLSVKTHRELAGAGTPRNDERFRLERPSVLALAEYVPGADVVIAGNVVTSRGILKHWTDSNRDQALGLQYLALRCEVRHLYTAFVKDAMCPECGSAPVGPGKELLFPRFGYTTAAWEPPRRGSRLTSIGEAEADASAEVAVTETERLAKLQVTSIKNFGDVEDLTVEYREEADLLIQNTGQHECGFAVCTRCGFAASEKKLLRKGKDDLPSDFTSHASVFRSNPDIPCWRKKDAEAPVLRNKVLAARESVDMILFDFPKSVQNQRAALFSLGRAMLLAGCRKLEIDTRELDVKTKPLRDGRLGLLLHETVVGGAGHCQEFLGFGRVLLLSAKTLLLGDDEHNGKCIKACIGCILDFAGQFHAKLLDRRHALDLLAAIGV
jgi:DEAD/DEAH box helicase domain-containing protein